ncbi:MAG: peptidoglycan DD-metalloendopeptidase family protein [Mogibacterium sp.]|nr:peptidoglycan DD-metalloendopeptidase family protein [Mogibacterium sp.]
MVPADKDKLEHDNEKREVYAEIAETKAPEPSEEELHALALAYARYLAEKNLEPGDVTFVEPEELLEEAETEAEAPAEEPTEEAEKPAKKKAAKKKPAKKKEAKPKADTKQKAPVIFTKYEPTDEEVRKIAGSLETTNKGEGRIAAFVDFHDRLQTMIDSAAADAGRDFVKAGHRITSTYRQSRRMIGLVILIIGVLAAVVLAIFDKYTVYEYAYNGKILGYVNNQEDVMDVLEIAGTKMTENNSGGSEIKFTANQNVTFNLVDARGKSIDDADTTVNKLVYMTDIETEAYGVYDGENLVAVVKDNEEAENLLNNAMAVLSEPDEGMTLVSTKFTNDLAIRPINVLLTSVQSYAEALENMTKGGEEIIFHIVEPEENLGSIARTFGVEPINIYDENNENVVTEIEQGDKICVRKIIDPVSVKMVETGRMKETLEYETIKKESDEYYEGETHIEQEGVDGIQIFDGTITKVAGEVTKRNADSIETVREKQDKIILVGTAERPKTAPTGTYVMPIHNYVLTSNFGFRWGRLHAGIDMGAPTGTPIYATDGGTVVKAEYYSGYGNVVFIQHEDGRQTRYAHCSKLLVRYGEKVYQGQNIALVGNTGHSFGSHLHFEIVLNGSPVNPRPYLGI